MEDKYKIFSLTKKEQKLIKEIEAAKKDPEFVKALKAFIKYHSS